MGRKYEPYEITRRSEHLGYDCMTYGIRVGPIILDGGDYGQKVGQPITAAQMRAMEDDAKMIVEASRARAKREQGSD